MSDRYKQLAKLELQIEKTMVILDEALQRTQEYPWKDWDARKVQDLIIKVKQTIKGGEN